MDAARAPGTRLLWAQPELMAVEGLAEALQGHGCHLPCPGPSKGAVMSSHWESGALAKFFAPSAPHGAGTGL